MTGVVDLVSFNSILARLEVVAQRLESAGGAAGNAYPANGPVTRAGQVAGPATAESSALVKSFGAFHESRFKTLKDAADATGVQDVQAATLFLEEACAMVRSILIAVDRCRKPKDEEWVKFFGGYTDLNSKAVKACDNRSDYFPHRKAAAEALQIVLMFTMPGPPDHIANVLETMDVYANKVFLRKIELETAWIKALKSYMKDLQEWCKEQAKLGFIWKHNGEDPVAYFASSPLGSVGDAAAPAAPAAGKAAGKGKGPPVPTAGAPKASSATAAPSGGGSSAVFGAISGFDISNLKKVTPEMKTKNRPDEERSALVSAPASAPKAETSFRSRDQKGPRGEPKLSLEKGGTHIVVENYDGVQDCKLDDISISKTLTIINCRKSTVQVPGKIKSICIDGCMQVNLICTDVLSTVEMVNSDRIKVQILGTVNSVAIDKCNGVNVILSKDSLGCAITSSKSSEMNVTIPEEGGEDGDVVELPIPEQFVTRIVGPKKLKSEVSDIYSS